ncbi:undecaprenyl-diphosphate phosphatase [Treponema sp. R6D11]
MNIINAIILGIVQGLTEFLPVSSSGHLVLLQKIFKIHEPSLFFDTMLHVGTLLAVVTVLWKDIFEILKKPIQKLTGFLILATIPAVIAALLFKDAIEEIFTTGKLLGVCFLITTVLLVTAELLSRRNKNASSAATEQDENGEKMTWLQALFIGVMQAIAIPPGISRSGATISGSLFCKLNRGFAARFSFLMSIPAILGAVVMQTKDLLKGGMADSSNFGVAAIIAGTITSAIVGFFAVKFMLKIIKEKSLFGFAIYTGVLGLLVLIDQVGLHVFF